MSEKRCKHCGTTKWSHGGTIQRCPGTDKRGNQVETTFMLPQCPKAIRPGWACSGFIDHDGDCTPERSTHFEAVHGRRIVENDDCKHCGKKHVDHVWVSGQCQ